MIYGSKCFLRIVDLRRSSITFPIIHENLNKLNNMTQRKNLSVSNSLCNIAASEDRKQFIGKCYVLKKFRRSYVDNEELNDGALKVSLNCEENINKLYHFYRVGRVVES